MAGSSEVVRPRRAHDETRPPSSWVNTDEVIAKGSRRMRGKRKRGDGADTDVMSLSHSTDEESDSPSSYPFRFFGSRWLSALPATSLTTFGVLGLATSLPASEATFGLVVFFPGMSASNLGYRSRYEQPLVLPQFRHL